MNLSTSTLTDPALRSQLQAVYETKKAAAVEAWKERPEQPAQATMTMPDGSVQTLTPITISAEKLSASFVDFDEWLEIMVQINESSQTTLAIATDRLATVEAMNPANSAEIAATFSQDGVLLAYVLEDGTLVTSNGSEKFLAGLNEDGQASGLSGEILADYLTSQVREQLAEAYPYLDVETFNSETSPTIGEFASRWSPNFDAEAIYADALADAQASLADARAWNDQFHANLYEIQGMLMQGGSA